MASISKGKASCEYTNCSATLSPDSIHLIYKLIDNYSDKIFNGVWNHDKKKFIIGVLFNWVELMCSLGSNKKHYVEKGT